MKKAEREALGLAFISLCVVAIATWATIYAFHSGFLSSDDRDSKVDPRLFDVMDARRACWDYAEDRFGQSKRYLRIDELSTRFEKSRDTYLVFFNADFPSTDSNSKTYPDGLYLECRVDPRTHRVTQFGTTNETGRPAGKGFNNFGVMGS